MSPRTKTLFPTRIYQASLKNAAVVNRKLLSDMEALRAQDKMGRDWSKANYAGGYTSYASLSDMHYRSPAFQQFAKEIERHAAAFAKAQHWEMRGLTLQMTACWFNIMGEGTYHTLHSHPHSVISGAYYVSIPKGSVALKLEDPRIGLFMNAPLQGHNTEKESRLYYEISPKEGALVLFDSWLRHEVPPNRSKKPRVSISFNFSLESED